MISLLLISTLLQPNAITGERLALITLAIVRILPLISSILANINSLSNAIDTIDRLYNIIFHTADVDSKNNVKTDRSISAKRSDLQSLKIENVTLKYPTVALDALM